MKNELKSIKDDIKQDKKLKAKIRKLMREAAEELKKEIRAIILDYEEINLDEHYQRVDRKDIDQLRREVERSNVDNTEAIKRMGMLYLGSRMTRDKLLENKIDIYTIKIADKQETLVKNYIDVSIKRETERKIKELGINKKPKVDYDFTNDFSNLIWRDQKELRNRLVNNINHSLTQGKNPKTWARDLKSLVRDDFKNASYAAERIAITESARAQTMIQESLFKEQGVKHWVWVAEPTACEECAGYDGEIFEVGTVGPLPGYVHPFCRCSRSMVD